MRCDDAELGQMGAQRINGLCSLSHQQVSYAVLHELRLLLGCFYWHSAHRRSPDRFAARHSIDRIVLVALDVGLHILRRHQTNLVAELRKLARPIMRRGTCLHADKARR